MRPTDEELRAEMTRLVSIGKAMTKRIQRAYGMAETDTLERYDEARERIDMILMDPEGYLRLPLPTTFAPAAWQLTDQAA